MVNPEIIKMRMAQYLAKIEKSALRKMYVVSMKCLVVFYSNTGNTEKVAKEISESLDCDLGPIVDLKSRGGSLGFFLAGFDAMLKSGTKIKEPDFDPSEYDLVVIGSPIWAGNIPPALRTYLDSNKGKISQVAFFVTKGGEKPGKVYDEMEEILEKKPVATYSVNSSELEYLPGFRVFIDRLRASPDE
jgi:flavodoxin